MILEQAKGELPIKIKADPENPTGSIWHQNPRTNEDWEHDLHKTKQEHTSTLIHTSSFPSSITSFSSPPISQRLQDSSSYSCNPLPSFSSSFLCPPPTSSFSSSLHPLPYSSSSLHPLPSSLCSLPSLSPAGGRKGRVCCGVCGKSFYDKGREQCGFCVCNYNHDTTNLGLQTPSVFTYAEFWSFVKFS